VKTSEQCGMCGEGIAKAVERAALIENQSGGVFEVVQIFFTCPECGTEYVTPEQYSVNFDRFMVAQGRDPVEVRANRPRMRRMDDK